MAYFGIDRREMSRLVKAGVFVPLYIEGKGRAFFRRADVMAAEEAGKVFKTAAAK